MAEEMNLLLDADKIIAQWAANPEDAIQLIPVMDELGKLTKAAAHAYLPAMAELGEKIHSVYETVIAGQLGCSPEVCRTLNNAHVALLDMVDAIAAGQNLYGIPDAVNEALDELLSTEAVTLSTLINDEIPVVDDEIAFADATSDEDAAEIPLAELEEVIELVDRPPGKRLMIRAGDLAQGAAIGDSIAINGCCLTVIDISGAQFGFDAGEDQAHFAVDVNVIGLGHCFSPFC